MPVAIARWTDGVKNIRPLDLRQVRSGVYHIGNTINAGHFRPFWFYPGRGVLHVGDDAVRPKPATASDRKQVAEGCYLLFLVKHQ